MYTISNGKCNTSSQVSIFLFVSSMDIRWFIVFFVILISRGKHSSRLVQCFSNVPDELMISPSNAFSLPSNSLHEMHILLRPARSGMRTYCVNAVDVENHQTVDTWMIRVDTRMPIISKQFGKDLISIDCLCCYLFVFV
jgi:hypothetical protein